MKQEGMKNMLSKTESENIDYVKFICIIMVVFIHADVSVEYVGSNNISLIIDWLQYFISQIVCRVAVPTFFLISGFLAYKQFKRDYGSIVLKKVKTLLIPYIIWNSIWIVIFSIGQRVEILRPFFNNDNRLISEFGWEQFLNAFGLLLLNGSSRPFLYPLWFIRDLFILNIILPFFKIFIGKIRFVAASIFFLFFLLSLTIWVIEFQSIFFFFLGLVFAKMKNKEWILKDIYLIEITILYLILAFTVSIYKNSILLNLSIFVGVFVLWFISFKVSKIVKMHKIISFTMFIYLSHEWMLSFFRKIIRMIIVSTNLSSLINYFILPWVIVTITYIIGIFLKAKLPVLYSFITGDR